MHCHLALVQLRSERGGGGGWRRRRRREAGRTADIKSNNPHLTGGELALRKPSLAISQPYIYISIYVEIIEYNNLNLA